MKHLFLLLAFFLPSFSFASVVPPQINSEYNSDGRWYSQSSDASSPLFDYLCSGNTQLCSDTFDVTHTAFQTSIYSANTPYFNTGASTTPTTCLYGGGNTSSPTPFNYFSVSSTTLTATSALCPSSDFVFVNINTCVSGGCYNSASSTLIGYSKWRFDGTRWVDSLGAGASGSWDFSTSTSLLPVDFTDFAQAIKDGIRNNTTVPECPGFTDILEIGNSSFWQDCVLPTIFNWLFVPSDSAIDYMIEQLSASSQYGSSFAYMLIMPIASAVSVSACDLDNPSACDVGSPLVLPVLDAYGSSTPYSLDPVSPIPSYFDDWLSAIVAVLILAGVSRVVLHKFL